MKKYDVDVIVVGGGHAGIEAAHAAAKLGGRVALTLPNPDKIGLMPCNPAIGGPGKSQLVFEIEALGGVMGRLADQTAIHARTLNASKGPAVQSLRVQNERDGYASAARSLIEASKGIEIIRGEVASLMVEGGSLQGVRLSDGRNIQAPSVVLCTGTFLCGVVWYGKQQREAGRQGEAPARYLSQSLLDTGHELLRFKTGTPPRIRSDSVDFSALELVPPDNPPSSFTGQPGAKVLSSPTWLTHTTPQTHQLIEANLQESAMYGGVIEGRGPRYCPSIEDKIVRFADKERHLLFVEPDGIETSEVYLQGFSSSMPPYLQDDMIRTLPGFEQAVIQRYAYAVEYDCLDPTQLGIDLMSRKLPGLFSAGQINGTSGYEEAAGQGLIAGINALRFATGQELITVRRDQGYLGVMLDDLVRGGINEPYRLLTSRNEYRLLHRQDNAESRLSALGHVWGLISDTRFEAIKASEKRIQEEISRFKKSRYEGKTGDKWLLQPNMRYEDVIALIGESSEGLSHSEKGKVEVLLKYASYIERSQKELDARKDYEHLSLRGIDFSNIASLSKEGLGMLQHHQPQSLGAAQRLRGVRDSDITALLVYLKGQQRRKAL
ncbi:MAG: tRNA uridine-5-carboxymethylaminomethyl(34) synthesis enzyme MnmG [Deinococcales bacterium]